MTKFNAPVKKEFEREAQDNGHGLEVDWTTISLYSLKQRARLPVIVLGITYEQSW